MAFENVNVTSLRNAIISCKNSLSSTTIEELVNNISSLNIWQSESQKNLKSALEKLSNIRYKELNNKLTTYLKVADYIEEYQNAQNDNSSLTDKYSILSKKLYYTENYVEENIDKDGNKVQKKCTRKVKDYNIQAQLSTIRNEIVQNKEIMENLNNNILNML